MGSKDTVFFFLFLNNFSHSAGTSKLPELGEVEMGVDPGTSGTNFYCSYLMLSSFFFFNLYISISQLVCLLSISIVLKWSSSAVLSSFIIAL